MNVNRSVVTGPRFADGSHAEAAEQKREVSANNAALTEKNAALEKILQEAKASAALQMLTIEAETKLLQQQIASQAAEEKAVAAVKEAASLARKVLHEQLQQRDREDAERARQ